jgi:Ala-tRNA(Pro) deacylase
MPIATRLKWYLDASGVRYEVLPHPHSSSSQETAREREIADLFHDCERGAMPPLGGPYRVPTVYDDALSTSSEIYFEAGDHEDVVHLRGQDFLRLLEGSLHGNFSQPA